MSRHGARETERNYPHCPITRKRMLPSRAIALTVADTLPVPGFIYQCTPCRTWHVTSQQWFWGGPVRGWVQNESSGMVETNQRRGGSRGNQDQQESSDRDRVHELQRAHRLRELDVLREQRWDRLAQPWDDQPLPGLPADGCDGD